MEGKTSVGRIDGINLIGYVTGSLGLGVLARNVVRLLERLNIPHKIFDLACYASSEKEQSQHQRQFVSSVDDLPYSVNLFVAPPPTLLWLISEAPQLFAKSDRLNVAYTIWELMVLPDAWKMALELFDVVVACSEFNRYVFDANLSGVHIISSLPPLFRPLAIGPFRERFGLPKDKIIFVFSFDPSSDIARKNPFAVIKAFRGAFPSDSSALLLIKVNNARVSVETQNAIRDLKNHCGVESHIRLITDDFTYEEVLSLYTSCDVFVSLHRSEGLGLGLMEAMMLGKPVIATGWSGNMSFMDHTSACLVGYHLVPVAANATHKYYKREFLGQDTVWAEPHIEDASAWMKRLVIDPELRSDIGRKAESHIGRYQREAEQGHFLKEIESIHCSRQFLPGITEVRNQKLQNLRPAMINSQSPIRQRVMYGLRRLIDRHVSWRFK